MNPRVISFHYLLNDSSGKFLDSSVGKAPLSFIEGAGQIIPGLEKELALLKIGDKKKITVPAADAYGEKNKDLVIKVSKDQLPAKEIKIGDRFSSESGPDDHSAVFLVSEIGDKEVTLDGNHPLAGQDLTFDVELTGVRNVTPQELEHGHAHGEHGHSH